MSESNEQKRNALHRCTRNSLSLERALAAYGKLLTEEGLPTVALIYAGNKCCFARLQPNGQLLDQEGQPLDLSSVYEARVFNQKAELRWRHTESGVGDAVLLTEEQQLPDWEAEEPVIVVGATPQEYLLWGESLPGESKRGWTKMATPRIGHYFAPVEQEDGGQVRVQLSAREYLSQESEHGNICVFEERWLSLSTVPAQKQGQKKEANNG